MDYDKPDAMADQANQLLRAVLKRPKSVHHMQLLMSLFPSLVNMQNPYRDYENFFVSNNFRDTEITTFCWNFGLPPWAYQAIPKNGPANQQLIPIT